MRSKNSRVAAAVIRESATRPKCAKVGIRKSMPIRREYKEGGSILLA